MSNSTRSMRSTFVLTRVRPGSLPMPIVVVGCLVFALGVGIADRLTGPDVSLVILYVLPVVAATWLGRVRLGVAMAAFVSVIGVLIAELDPGPATGGVWIWNAVVPFAFYLLVVWLVAGQRQLLESQERLASTDPLTGALSRRAFYDRVEIELARARREDAPVAFIYLDVDGLKVVNDTISHAAGDELLQRFAEVVDETTRISDLFGRIGGDEFALLLPGAGAEQAIRIGERVLAELRSAPGTPSSASIGVVACLHAPEQLEGIVRLADQLMYLAKRDGGAVVRWTVFDPHQYIDLRAQPEPSSTSSPSAEGPAASA